MPQRIIGVSKRLIETAGEEFLKNGFENSSVRTIAEKAQTSPRAIYTRFENKEALFQAAQLSGYTNMSHFSKSFVKKFGVLPKDYSIS